MKNIFFIILIGILVSCKQQPGSKKYPDGDDAAIRDSLTHTLTEIQGRNTIVGFSVAIVNETETLYKKGFGYSDKEAKKVYDENTVQNIASISKTLIGIALLKAQELGKLQLDDPVNKYLPFKVKNPYYPEEPITLRHLATHTSTIADTDYYDRSYIMKEPLDTSKIASKQVPDYFTAPETRIPLEDFLEKIVSEQGEWYQKKGFLEQRPGAIFEYSNIGATLAAMTLEFAVGEPFPVFTEKHILQPLGMSDSGWSFETIDFQNHSRLYENPTSALPYYSLITYPDGGFTTSIADMGKYLNELIKAYNEEGTLLNKLSYKEYFTPQLQNENFLERDEEETYNDEYNMGIFMGFSAKEYIGHTGGDPGVSSFMFFNKETNIGRILIVNTDLDETGVKDFITIWNTLGEYENKMFSSSELKP